jgi:uncharacterized membrane protein YphA (DoxX/SURF4 family)
MDVVFLAGRILLAVPFIQSGLMVHFSRQGVEYHAPTARRRRH